MSAQVDKVTALLRQLGYALEDATGGTSGGSSGGEVSTPEIIEMMEENAEAWRRTTDPEEWKRLHEENKMLGALIGAKYDPDSGKWDYSNVDYGYWDLDGLRPMSLMDFSGDGYAQLQAQGRALTSEDAYAQPSYATYSTAGSSYNDDHSQNYYINGVKVGSDTAQRSFADVCGLISLNMGT